MNFLTPSIVVQDFFFLGVEGIVFFDVLIASKHAYLKVFLSQLSPIGQILHETFVQTDAELPTDTCEYQGCTGTVCYLWHHEGSRHLQGNWFFPCFFFFSFSFFLSSVANVGDSFAFLVKENGDVIPLTSEHSLLISSERERIQAMGVELYEGQVREKSGKGFGM